MRRIKVGVLTSILAAALTSLLCSTGVSEGTTEGNGAEWSGCPLDWTSNEKETSCTFAGLSALLDVAIAATQPRNHKVTVFHNHCINQSRVVTYSPCLKL